MLPEIVTASLVVCSVSFLRVSVGFAAVPSRLCMTFYQFVPFPCPIRGQRKLI